MREREGDEAFFDVFHEEIAHWIAPRRDVDDDSDAVPANDDGRYFPQVDNHLFGLALSGGGVRAATFPLGVLQRLAQLGILRFVDILSTASGGGYLGAQLEQPHRGRIRLRVGKGQLSLQVHRRRG